MLPDTTGPLFMQGSAYEWASDGSGTSRAVGFFTEAERPNPSGPAMRLGTHATSFRDGLLDAPRVINPGRVLHPDGDHLGDSGHRGAKVIQFVPPRRDMVPRPKTVRTGPPPPLRPLAWEPSELVEDSVLDRQLVLLGQEREGTPAPKILLQDPARRCFAAHWPGVLEPDYARTAFDRLLHSSPWAELTNKRGEVARQTCWYVQKGCSCSYTYGTARVCASRKPSAEFRSAIEDLAEKIFTNLWPWLPREFWPNSANLNLYTDTGQSVGWHADDETLFQGQELDCPIVSVSLGAQREFWLALKQKHVLESHAHSINSDTASNPPLRDPVGMEPHRRSIIETDLCDGDVMTMEGLCQKYCVHFVPHDMRYTTPSLADPSESGFAQASHPRQSIRINVTFRWIRDHKQRCKLFSGGIKRLFCELGSSALARAAPNLTEPRSSIDWAGGRFVSWKSCHGCDHDGWKGGRNCVKYKKFFLCRRCWDRAKEVGDSILPELPTDQEAAAERKAQRLSRLRGTVDCRPAEPAHQGYDLYSESVVNVGPEINWGAGVPTHHHGIGIDGTPHFSASSCSLVASEHQYSNDHHGGYDFPGQQAYYNVHSAIGGLDSNGAFTYYQ